MGHSIDLLESTCMNIGFNILKNLEILNNEGILHKDLKPQNITFGAISRSNEVDKLNIRILDFGNSKNTLLKRYLKIKLLNKLKN